jgi:hypothetical protein
LEQVFSRRYATECFSVNHIPAMNRRAEFKRRDAAPKMVAATPGPLSVFLIVVAERLNRSESLNRRVAAAR